MSELFVTCAGCGKRYRGSASSKKFKCNACGNLFTFPDQPRKPSPGKVLCSHCWMEVDVHEDLTSCPGCAQKISPAYGGRAAPPSALAGGVAEGSSADAGQLAALVKERDELLVARKQQEKVLAELMAQVALAKAASGGTAQENDADAPARWELQMEVGELKSKVDLLDRQLQQVTAERDNAVQAKGQAAAIAGAQGEVDSLRQELTAAAAARDEALTRAQEAENALNQFREAAVQALEPLAVEYKQSMSVILSEAEALLAAEEQIRLDAAQLQSLGESLKTRLAAVRQQMLSRLGEALGTNVDESRENAAGSPEPSAPPSDAAGSSTAA